MSVKFRHITLTTKGKLYSACPQHETVFLSTLVIPCTVNTQHILYVQCYGYGVFWYVLISVFLVSV